MMKYFRDHKKRSKIIIIFLISLFVVSTTFARYLLNIINNYIVESKHMYFYSPELDINGRSHKVQNWDKNDYTITINLHNYKNEKRVTDVDINYSINIDSCGGDTATSKVTCTLSKTSGVIGGSTTANNDSYNIVVKPKVGVTIDEDDEIKIVTSVTATNPYKKKIYGTYSMSIQQKDFSYKLIDNVGDLYATLEIKNSLTNYKVFQAFGTHRVGDIIMQNEYDTLSDTNKAKCYSARINLDIDTTKFRVDETNNFYINRLTDATNQMTTDSNGYIKTFAFDMKTSSVAKIILFKLDSSQKYTKDNFGTLVSDLATNE